MPEIIQRLSIDVYPNDWAQVYTSHEYDRTRINITIDQEMIDTINWLKKYKTQMEQEAKIRAENPAAHSAYEQYQAMLRLVKP